MTELTWVLTSCLLILTVALLRLILGRRMSPGLRYALWALVLVRLMYPGALWHSPVRVTQPEFVRDMEAMRGDESLRPEEDGSASGVIDDGESQTGTEPPAFTPDGGDKYVAVDVTPERFERMELALELRNILEAVWLGGATVAAGAMVCANISLYIKLRRRRAALPSEYPVRVWSVEGLESSCLFAGGVYVNRETAENPERFACVMAHELSHRRHLDPIWAVLRCAAIAVHWYNPLVWYAGSLSRQDGELFADAGAIRRLGEDARVSYGAAVIELSRRSSPMTPFSAATSMSGTKRQLRERVRMIAQRPRTTIAVGLTAAIIAAVAVGCAFAGGNNDASAKSEDGGGVPAPETQTTQPEDIFTLPGDGDTLGAVLDGLGAGDIDLAFYTYDGPEGSVNGGGAILADKYLERLRSAVWSEVEPGNYDYYFNTVLSPADSARQWKITVIQSTNIIHLEAPAGDVWLEARSTPEIEGMTDWHIYTTVYNWYMDAVSASEHGSGGTPITAEELSSWRERLRGSYDLEGIGYPSSVNGFFLSDWSDPRDLDLGEFISYFGWPEILDFRDEEPSSEELADVYEAVSAAQEDVSWFGSVPCHKIPVYAVDLALEHYAGITIDDLSRDWRSELLYLEKYDSFYNFNSDFGPGWFYPLYGERQGDILTLWSDGHVLTVKQSGDEWKLMSHLPIE